MLRTLAIAAFISAATIIGATPAQATPKHCAKHEAGVIYIHACSKGPGGNGWDRFAINDIIKHWNETPSHPNYNKYPNRLNTDPNDVQ